MSKESAPQLAARWTAVAHDANTVEFRTGVWNSRNITLQDEDEKGNLWQLVMLLRQGRTSKEIGKTLGLRTSQVDDVVDSMRALGLVVDSPESALDAYLDEVPTLGAESGINFKRVILVGDEILTSSISAQLSASLPDMPIEVTSEPFRPASSPIAVWEDSLAREAEASSYRQFGDDLVVVATSANDPDRFRFIDLMSAIAGFTWIPAMIDGPFLFVGPTAIPDQSAGYRDFETRVAMNLRERDSYLKFKSALASGAHLRAEANVLPPLAGIVASFASLEVVNLVECGTTPTLNKVLSIYVPTMEIAYQEVLPLPGGVDGPYGRRDATALYFDAREWLLDPRLEN